MHGYLDDWLPSYEGYSAQLACYSGEITHPPHNLPFGFTVERAERDMTAGERYWLDAGLID